MTESTPGAAARAPIVIGQLPRPPFAVRAGAAVVRRAVEALPARSSVVCPSRAGLQQLAVVGLGVLAGLQSVLAGPRRIVGQRQSLRDEIVVDLTIGGGVPERVVLDGRRLLSRLVLAQQMADLVDQHGRVLFHGVRREPRVVVIEPPA